MTRIDRSDAQLDAEAAAPVPCRTCSKPMLPDYPHNHATEPRSDYDPMPRKPATKAGLVALIRQEYTAEIPHHLHVHHVPSQAEPIGVSQYSTEAAGWVPSEESVMALDAGELGSPPWSVPFHRRIGSYRFWEGEVVQSDSNLSHAPWTRNLNGVRRWCARSHRAWYEHRKAPLCWILTGHVIIGGRSPGRAAQILQDEGFAISEETADRLLFGHERDDGRHQSGALDMWWAWVADDLNGLTLKRVRRPAA